MRKRKLWINANRTGSTKVHHGKAHIMHLTWLKEVIIHLNLADIVLFNTLQVKKKRIIGLSLTIKKDKIYMEETLSQNVSIYYFFLLRANNKVTNKTHLLLAICACTLPRNACSKFLHAQTLHAQVLSVQERKQSPPFLGFAAHDKTKQIH